MGIHICDYMYVTFWFMHVKCVQCTFIWHIWELIRQTWENRFLPPRNDFINQNKNIDKVDVDDNIDRGNQIYIIWSWATPLLCFVRPPPRKQCRSPVSDWNPLPRKRIRLQILLTSKTPAKDANRCWKNMMMTFFAQFPLDAIMSVNTNLDGLLFR